MHLLLSTLSTLVLSWLIIFVAPRIIDTVRAYNFHAPANVVAIDTRLALTARGTDIFYASEPQINTQTDFNKNCGTEERTTAILGCFSRDRIYLYDLKNTELDGTLEVTAAHEMLHAAYQRLTILERMQVDQMIKDQYEKIKNDKAITQLMAYYEASEPGQEINELHSIIGTTVATLDPKLEQYYRQYFDNRGAVVKLNEKYNEVFTKLQSESEALEAQLSAAETELTALLAQYDQDKTQLEADIVTFNARTKAGNFSSESAFYAARQELLARIDDLNTRRDEINAKVTAYNDKVEALNKISTHTSDLYKSMNGAEATGNLQY